MIRSTTEEKEKQISNVKAFQEHHSSEAQQALNHLKQVAVSDGNIFDALMEAAKVCSLGQMSNALYQVGGQYRRNM